MPKPYVYFSQDKFDEICGLLSEGRNLREISRMENMPTASHIMEWSEKSDELRAQYTRARDKGYDLMADDIADIADHDDTEQARQRIDARKWLLSKVLPRSTATSRVLRASSPSTGLRSARKPLRNTSRSTAGVEHPNT